MNTIQFKKWLQKNFFKKIDNYEILKKAIQLGNVKQEKIKHEIESSFNSKEKLKLIKLTHIYSLTYPKNRIIRAQDFIKIKEFLIFLENVKEKTNFHLDISLIKKIINLPLSPILKKEKKFVVNLDFKGGKIMKMSLAFNPKSLSKLLKFFSEDFSILPKIKKKSLAFVNIDFYPNNNAKLKFYYFYEISNNLEKLIIFRKIKSLSIIKTLNLLLNSKFPKNYIYVMEKLEKNRLRFGGIYFCFSKKDKIKLRDFLALKLPLNWKIFLIHLNHLNLISKFNITFFAFKPRNMIEIYFR